MKSSSQAETLRTHVYETLRVTLREGLIGGQVTVTERDLAEQLGVSRTPVREALVLLTHEGFIRATGRGFSMPRLSPGDISDLYEVRRMLEPRALASALDHLSPHDLRSLRETLVAQESADSAADADAFAEGNSKFRDIWLSAVPNRRLRQMIENHDDHVRWLRKATLDDGKVRRKVICGLRKISSALQARDQSAVAVAMAAHLDAAELVLKSSLQPD